jgi:hypothetical protein
VEHLKWAEFALEYLRDRRKSIQDDFNALMTELRNSGASRGDPWYADVKSIVPTLHHYLLESIADIRLPDKNFSLPREVAEKLAEFRAKQANAKVTEIKGSHAVFVSQPAAVANVIDEAARSAH